MLPRAGVEGQVLWGPGGSAVQPFRRPRICMNLAAVKTLIQSRPNRVSWSLPEAPGIVRGVSDMGHQASDMGRQTSTWDKLRPRRTIA